jgi:predicted PurR-regulated permease PerM
MTDSILAADEAISAGMTFKKAGDWILLAGLAVVLYFCFRILEPFLVPIFAALILCTLLAPLHSAFVRDLRGRRSLAAFLVCLLLTVVILVPLVFLSVSLANEATDAYQRLKDPETLRKIESWFAPGGVFLSRIQSWLPSSIQLDKLQIGTRLSAQAQQIGIGALAVATTFAAGIFNVLVDYFLMSIVLFFLLRDFDYFARSVRLISPLSAQQEELFMERFRKVTRATVLGNLLTALTQGSISGLIFLTLGLPNFVLWGALTALLSLVPLVGTALIWVPWTIYLFVVGSPVKATIFLIFQVVVVGGIDNILRPLLIEGSVKMHTLLVFFSILGGIGYFGILGMFFGPLIFAIALTLLEFYLLPTPLPEPLPATPTPVEAPSNSSIPDA